MKNKDWNPELYLKFNKERIQPSIDLVSRINFDNPENIIDIGCGPGNSTQILVGRWPKAKVTGIDNSPAMIKKAKSDYPDQEWIVADAGNFSSEEKYDIVFSNATIQWIPNHEKLLSDFKLLLTSKGKLAVQVPLFWDMPLGKSIAEIGGSDKWKKYTGETKKDLLIHDYHFYYDVLSGLFSTVDIWVTHYMHVMSSHESILEMISSTGLKPFLEKLETEKDKSEFTEEVLKGIKRNYFMQENGKVLFPFKRLFFIAGN
jgi:trans-aconitate 2-methyltransferase